MNFVAMRKITPADTHADEYAASATCLLFRMGTGGGRLCDQDQDGSTDERRILWLSAKFQRLEYEYPRSAFQVSWTHDTTYSVLVLMRRSQFAESRCVCPETPLEMTTMMEGKAGSATAWATCRSSSSGNFASGCIIIKVNKIDDRRINDGMSACAACVRSCSLMHLVHLSDAPRGLFK